jgi:hypothetical protein
MNPGNRPRIVIVDGDAASRELVLELLERNVECLHLRSSARGSMANRLDGALYDADFGYVGDRGAAIQLLDELSPDAVIAGSERGVVFAELLSRGLNLPSNKAELVGARRRALAVLGQARRQNSTAAAGQIPQFVVNAVCQSGRLFVTDAWRMLHVAGQSGPLLGGFRLLDPALCQTEALFAVAHAGLDRLGIREGAVHIQLAWTADGPALVGAGVCLASDPMDRSAYVASGLRTQASVLAGLLVGAERDLDATATAHRYGLARHMTKLVFSFPEPAVIASAVGLARLRQLASFHSLKRPLARGDMVRSNNGWLAEGGVVYLGHDRAQQISADVIQFRLWESRGELYGLAPQAEARAL